MSVHAAEVLDNVDLPLPGRREGKVRISWDLPNGQRLFVTTDRLSAFDRVIGLVPGKGQMLNELAHWWFQHLEPTLKAEGLHHHAISTPDPNALVAVAATPLPVEVIVRRAITGVTSTSLWHRYSQGARVIDGHSLPDGLAKNELLPSSIITPTTKADAGGHDEPLSVAEVASRGLVDPRLWEQVCSAALAVFAEGERVAAAAGLVLADTKYEFGVDDAGNLLLIDEVHTPDSSRFWERSTYEARLGAGQEPESMDKEIIRKAFAEIGFRGDWEVPVLDASVWSNVADGYQRAYERLTGSRLVVPVGPITNRIHASLKTAGLI
jgi:phosphoribosylaminoimidazole-succinocarboxamide synthase